MVRLVFIAVAVNPAAMVWTAPIDALHGSRSSKVSYAEGSVAGGSTAGWTSVVGEEGVGAVRSVLHQANRLRKTVDPDTPAGRLQSHAAVPALQAKDHLVFTQLPDKGKVALYPGQSERIDYIGKRDKVVRKAATGAGQLGTDLDATIAEDRRPGGTTGLRVLQVDRVNHAFARGVKPARTVAPPNCLEGYWPHRYTGGSRNGASRRGSVASEFSSTVWSASTTKHRPATAGAPVQQQQHGSGSPTGAPSGARAIYAPSLSNLREVSEPA